MSARSVIDTTVPIYQIDADENLGRLVKARIAPQWLVDSIRENGLLNAITVEKIGKDRYRLIAGHSRLLAIKELGEELVRVSVRHFESDARARMAAIAENGHRNDLSLYDETMLVYRLITKHHVDPEDVAKNLSKQRKDIRAMIRAPEVLSSAQLDAFKKCTSRSQARVFLAAAMLHTPAARNKILASEEAPEKAVRTKRASMIAEMISNFDSDLQGKFRGTPLTPRDRAIASATLGWTVHREKEPFTFDKPKGKRPNTRARAADPDFDIDLDLDSELINVR